nr:probable serine/threonine-protein kinase roco5 isoform X1 [Tanacetum cinerariifolium]
FFEKHSSTQQSQFLKALGITRQVSTLYLQILKFYFQFPDLVSRTIFVNHHLHECFPRHTERLATPSVPLKGHFILRLRSDTNGSQDGNIAPSTLGFAQPVMPLQLESVVLQEKSVEQYGQPISYNRTDSLLGASHRREVSLMDEDFFDYTNREVSSVGHEEYYSRMQKEIPSVKGKEDN